MKSAFAVAILSALTLSACAGGSQMSGSAPTSVQAAPTSPSFSTPEPTRPRATQGGGNAGSTGNTGNDGKGGAGSAGGGGPT
jgi:outer membrane lipoprotein SlyB